MPTNPEQRARWLEPGTLLTLYDLDLRAWTDGPLLHFHGGTDPDTAQVIEFQGTALSPYQYTPYPIKAEGFDWSTRGTLPRPRLSVSNVGSATSALLRQFDDLVGAIVTMRRTFRNYVKIDGVAGDEWSGQPPWKEFTPFIFIVDRKTGENATVVSFELATAFDAEGILLPRRQILATACPWSYRGGDCGYTGVEKTNRLGTAFGTTNYHGLWSASHPYTTNDSCHLLVNGIQVRYVSKVANNLNHRPPNENYWWADVCLKKLTDCQLHYGENAELPFGGFPAAAKLT